MRKIEYHKKTPGYGHYCKILNLADYVLADLDEIAEQAGWPPVECVYRQYLTSDTRGNGRLHLLLSHADGSETAIECLKPRQNVFSIVQAARKLMSYGLIAQHRLQDWPRLVFAIGDIKSLPVEALSDAELPFKVLVMGNLPQVTFQ